MRFLGALKNPIQYSGTSILSVKLPLFATSLALLTAHGQNPRCIAKYPFPTNINSKYTEVMTICITDNEPQKASKL